MSNIGQRIRDWRDTLARSEAFEAGDLDELEDHLRDEMANLVAVGLSEVEAFEIATRRLGSVDALDNEFRKVNAEAIRGRRIQWMLAGYLAVVCVVAVIRLFGNVFVSIGAAYGIVGSGLVAVYGSACVACTLGFLFLLTTKARAGALSFVDRARKRAQSMPGALFILAAVVLMVAVSRMLQVAPTLLMVRILGAREFGLFVFGSRVLEQIVAVIMPALLLAVMIGIDRRYRSVAVGSPLRE